MMKKIMLCFITAILLIGCGAKEAGNTITNNDEIIKENEMSEVVGEVIYIYVSYEVSSGENKSIAINFADGARKVATITSEINEVNDTYEHCEELQEFIKTNIMQSSGEALAEDADDVHNSWEVIISFENEDDTIIERGEKYPQYWEELIGLMEK